MDAGDGDTTQTRRVMEAAEMRRYIPDGPPRYIPDGPSHGPDLIGTVVTPEKVGEGQRGSLTRAGIDAAPGGWIEPRCAQLAAAEHR